MNFNEIFSKNVTCDNVKSHKKSELQSLFRKHNFRATTMGPPPPPPPPVFLGLIYLPLSSFNTLRPCCVVYGLRS